MAKMKKNEVNLQLQAICFEVIENQLRDNDPEETAVTLKRLMDLGYSREHSMKLIAQVAVYEIHAVLKNKETFNEVRYVANLKALPKEPK